MALLSRLLGHASDLTPEQTREELDGILLPEEPVEVAFKVIRDLFVFTDRRLILVDNRVLPAGKSITSWCPTEPSPPIRSRRPARWTWIPSSRSGPPAGRIRSRKRSSAAPTSAASRRRSLQRSEHRPACPRNRFRLDCWAYGTTGSARATRGIGAGPARDGEK